MLYVDPTFIAQIVRVVIEVVLNAPASTTLVAPTVQIMLMVTTPADSMVTETIKELMSSPKCRNVEVINNSTRSGSNHREVNYINYK